MKAELCWVGCVLQGLEFIADNKEEQSRTLLGNVASVNEELQGISASLHTGAMLVMKNAVLHGESFTVPPWRLQPRSTATLCRLWCCCRCLIKARAHGLMSSRAVYGHLTFVLCPYSCACWRRQVCGC